MRWIGWFLLSMLCAYAAPAQNVSEQYLVAAANHDRAEAGLEPVRTDRLLEQAALAHANAMAAHGEISHQFPGEPDLAARAGAAGARFSLITENVAEAPTSLKIHDLWMKSAGHRANLLDPAVDSVGIAVVSVRGQLYAVEDFSRSVQHLTPGQQESTVASLLAPSGIRLLADPADARQTCQLKTGYSGLRQPWFIMRYTTSSLDRLPDQLVERLASGKYHQASVGACTTGRAAGFTSFSLAVLLFP